MTNAVIVLGIAVFMLAIATIVNSLTIMVHMRTHKRNDHGT